MNHKKDKRLTYDSNSASVKPCLFISDKLNFKTVSKDCFPWAFLWNSTFYFSWISLTLHFNIVNNDTHSVPASEIVC